MDTCETKNSEKYMDTHEPNNFEKNMDLTGTVNNIADSINILDPESSVMDIDVNLTGNEKNGLNANKENKENLDPVACFNIVQQKGGKNLSLVRDQMKEKKQKGKKNIVKFLFFYI